MKKFMYITIVCALLGFAACEDHKAAHYENAGSGQTVWEYISGNNAYSVFCTKIKESGLDAVLQRTSSFTLFVPGNEAFEGKAYTPEEWKNLLSYHICSGFFPQPVLQNTPRLQTLLDNSTETDGKKLSSVQHKFLNVSFKDGKPVVDQVAVEGEAVVENGVVYTVNTLLEPLPSLWEYISLQQEQFSMIYDYFKSVESVEFDKANSVKIGFDESGRDVYDSVWIVKNERFEEVADIGSEKQVYTLGLISDAVWNRVTSSFPAYSELPAEVRERIFADAFAAYTFQELYSDCPFTAQNIRGNEVTLKVEDVVKQSPVSNGKIYELAENGLTIDFTAYLRPFKVEMEKLAVFSGNNIEDDGLIGGAVKNPTDVVESQIPGGGILKGRRFTHKLNNTANRIPFGIYIDKENILPVKYKVRWKLINSDPSRLDKYNWMQFKEFAKGANGVAAQYNLVCNQDLRSQAKDLEVRVYDSEMNLLYTQEEIIKNKELKEATNSEAMPVPFKLLRTGQPEIYRRMKDSPVLYVEYDWKFDNDRLLKGRAYIGMALELNTKSVVGDEIYIDVDNIELIPAL